MSATCIADRKAAALFEGKRGPDGTAEVLADGKPLELAPSLRLRKHSPTGFEWGYGGSGPSQLALALLLAAGVEEGAALGVYQQFKAECVAQLPGPTWELEAAHIRTWAYDAVH